MTTEFNKFGGRKPAATWKMDLIVGMRSLSLQFHTEFKEKLIILGIASGTG